MLESLLPFMTVKVGEVVLEQALKLTQAAAEDYVKDFFKDCLKGTVALANPAVTKKAVGSALKEFLEIAIEELEDKGLSGAEIRDRYYDLALVEFVKDEAVKPFLGQAFEQDCRVVDWGALAGIWGRSQLRGKAFPVMPNEFDWAEVGKAYLKKVRKIVRDTPELRSLLEIALAEQQTESLKALAGVNPGFDVAKYRQSLQCSYGALKLHTLDSTDRADPMKLWNMFIEQTVREALPPLRYEIPLDVKRQLQAEGGLERDLSPEDLAHYRQEYFQQPVCKVLVALADAPKAMILGDPGAGKSTLLQYLALQWVEGAASALPLLIELREYALAGVNGFLEFFHRGRGADWQFDAVRLDEYLRSQPTVVMFDGLDEVFDRSTQGTIVDEIVRFGQTYPLAQVLVTSRIIGYNPERLQQAEFKQFTIQPLDQKDRHEFIDRWYDLALGSDPDKARLVTRLKDAIANSKAIQNLADNPLLLTMMAILNRRQELPRDRADLYDQASRVLLYHWDVDHKRLQLPMDAIGRREKQEMLRLIAYAMQTSEEGLKGNLIGADRLTRILTDYLRDQGFEAPREKANGLIEQLRHRNWILCDRGADTYGFVHRTFLEYFCAMEIVHRFEKTRTMTFEQLRDEVFGGHWQDETWHEVLKLICGAIDPEFASQLIKNLVNLERTDARKNWFSVKEVGNLILALDCLEEVKNRSTSADISEAILAAVKQKVEDPLINSGNLQDTKKLAETFGRVLRGDSTILCWLKDCLEGVYTEEVHTHYFASCALVKGWKQDPNILSILMNCVQQGHVSQSARTAALAIVEDWKSHPDVLPFLKHLAQESLNSRTRGAALLALSQAYREDSHILLLLKAAQEDKEYYVRGVAIESLAQSYKTDSETILILRKSQKDEHQYVRGIATRELGEYCGEHPDILSLIVTTALIDQDWRVRGIAAELIIKHRQEISEAFKILRQIAMEDPYERKAEFESNPRLLTSQALLRYYPTHPKTLELLHDRALNDPDDQLRTWAQEQLQKLEANP
jgi:3-methyladenine DNA glycosylase AlkC